MTNTYYQKRKARERYKNLPEDEKEKKAEKGLKKISIFYPRLLHFPLLHPTKYFMLNFYGTSKKIIRKQTLICL